MKLNDFILKTGPKKLAKILEVEPSTVSSWKVGKSFPRARYLKEINRLSRGQVSYDEMVNHFLRHQ